MTVTIIDSLGLLSRQQKESLDLGLNWTLKLPGLQIVEVTLDRCHNGISEQVSCHVRAKFSDKSLVVANLQAASSEDAVRRVIGIIPKKLVRHIFGVRALTEKVIMVCRLRSGQTPEWSCRQAAGIRVPWNQATRREAGEPGIHSLFQSFLPKQQESKDYYYLNN